MLDTGVYIDYYVRGKFEEYVTDLPRLRLSSVVFLELKIGAHEENERQFVNTLRKTFADRKRILIPTLSDYDKAGEILQRLQSEKGYDLKKSIGLINDALIACSARRVGATLVTKNRTDFENIQAYHAFHLHVVS